MTLALKMGTYLGGPGAVPALLTSLKELRLRDGSIVYDRVAATILTRV